MFFISTVSVQATKESLPQIDYSRRILTYVYSGIQKQSVDSCCSPLHSIPPLLGGGLLHCLVLVFVLPLQEDHAAQQLQLPSMATTAGQSHTLGHFTPMCLTSQISQRFKGDDVMTRAQRCGRTVCANLCASESPRRPVQCSQQDRHSHTWCLREETG